jgi:hypothetical protein
MSLETRLTGEEEEWLLRAATSPRGVMPPSVVAALVAVGFGTKNARGTLDINDAGRLYLNARDLSVKIEKRPRFHRTAGRSLR